MSRCRLSLLPALATGLGVSLATNALSAQEPPLQALQQRVEAATSALTQLDERAAACHTALDSEPADDAQPPCEQFMQALDGELVADYLAHCAALKQWREQFISDDTGQLAQAQSGQYLQLMTGVELACGENALARRTRYVSDTFALLRNRSVRNTSADAGLRRRLAEMELESALDRERRALQDSIRRQQSRRLSETRRQWDDLENELIRQQISNPSPFRPFPPN